MKINLGLLPFIGMVMVFTYLMADLMSSPSCPEADSADALHSPLVGNQVSTTRMRKLPDTAARHINEPAAYRPKQGEWE
jgi:hypothetical protein